MTCLRGRGAVISVLLGLSTLLLANCAATGGGYANGPDVRIGLDYYDPWFSGYGTYGGWGPGYRVGPPRQVMPRRDSAGERRPARGYRPAPGARPVPSIPSRPHPRSPRPGR